MSIRSTEDLSKETGETVLTGSAGWQENKHHILPLSLKVFENLMFGKIWIFIFKTFATFVFPTSDSAKQALFFSNLTFIL